MTCALCGLKFTEAQAAASACAACPLHHGCKLVCCPRCGYEFPRVPLWLQALAGKKEKKNGTK
jgi:hypothetical protein